MSVISVIRSKDRGRTLFRKVHGVRLTHGYACDEALVYELVDFVEGFQHFFGWEGDVASLVQDEDGISPIAAIEFPVSFEGGIGNTRDLPVVISALESRVDVQSSLTILCL